MRETEHFLNAGYGWECKRCRAADAADRQRSAESQCSADERSLPVSAATPMPDTLPRFFREGEAEERETRLSTRALARWLDTHDGRALHCPRCGAEEMLNDE